MGKETHTNALAIPDEVLMKKIYLIRGHKVMLDSDLSEIYNVGTKVLKQAVRRNIKRFPDDFMFELTIEENEIIRSQFVTLKRGQHSKYLPFAFTEQGVAMLSSVLNSELAIMVNIQDTLKFPRNSNSMPGLFPGAVTRVNHSGCIQDKVIQQKAVDQMLTATMFNLTGKKSVQGELGLQNGLPDWSSYFEGLKNFNLWFRQSKTEGKDFRQALVTFDSPGDQEIFLHNASLIPSGDGWKSKEDQAEKWVVKKIGEKTIWVEVR